VIPKITKLARKTVSEQWRHQALGRLELTLVVNTSFSFSEYPLTVVRICLKRQSYILVFTATE